MICAVDIRYHPELVDLREKIECMVRANKSRARQMRTSLADLILNLKTLPEGGETHERSELIRKDEIPDFKYPFGVLTAAQGAYDDIGKLLADRQVTEESVEDLVVAHSSIISKVIPIREEEKKSHHHWDWKRTRICLTDLHSGLNRILSEELFNGAIVQEMQSSERQAKETCRITEERLRVQLPRIARLHMSTIGSSHKLPVAPEAVDEDDGIIDAMAGLKIDDGGTVVCRDVPDTIVVFDESGCIPAYELLGLSRLGRNIVGMLLVGDKKQLPPYDPSQGRGVVTIASARNTRGFSRRNSGLARQSSHGDVEKIKSLLDVSVLTVDDAKIKLTTQYRVPRDISDLLNVRIYKGDYVTSPTCKAPAKGFHFIHVAMPSDRTASKYINEAEIESALDLVKQHKREGYESIMILTPVSPLLSWFSRRSNLPWSYDLTLTFRSLQYKKQQRLMQFKLKSRCNDVSILTIDQCQGQEADIVILSLVQKPTRFLNKNRLNVALSRCRRKLFLLTDRLQFRKAASNCQWDCALLAEDLLELGGCMKHIHGSDW